MNIQTVTRIVFAFGLAVTAGSTLSQSPAQLQVAENSLYVQVLGSDDTRVTNLTRDDFTVLRDGKPQSVTAFDSVETPLHVLLLIDRMESQENRWKIMGPGIQRVFSALRPKDQVAIAAFFDKPSMLQNWMSVPAGQPLDGTLESIRRQLSAFSSGAPLPRGTDGASPPVIAMPIDLNPPEKDWYGALTWAVTQSRKVSGRKALIVLTDSYQPQTKVSISGNGQRVFVDSEKDGNFQKLLRTVIESEIPFYFVTMDTDMNPPDGFPFESIGIGPIPLGLSDLMQIRSRMEQLALRTGGNVVYPKRLEDVGGLWEQIVRELGTSYHLRYRSSGSSESPSDGKIEVRVRGEHFRVRRTGVALTP